MEDPVSGPLQNRSILGAAGGVPPLAAAAAEVLRAAQDPLTSAQLRNRWPSKQKPKPAALEAALAELERLGKAARLPGRGRKPVWSAWPLETWLEQARGRILEAVRESKAPLGEKELRAATGWPKELHPAPLGALLAELEQAGELKPWPGKTRRWWRLSPAEMLPAALLEALDARAMRRTEWLRAAKARLKGVPARKWSEAAEELIAQGHVLCYTLRIDGRKVDACARAGCRAAFLELYRPMLERLKDDWRRLGATEEQIARFLSGPASGEAAELLFAELKRLERESPPPNPVSALRSRTALRGIPKEEFDRAALELLAQGRIYMARHDHAGRLTEEERRQLVADGAGNFYVSVTARH